MSANPSTPRTPETPGTPPTANNNEQFNFILTYLYRAQRDVKNMLKTIKDETTAEFEKIKEGLEEFYTQTNQKFEDVEVFIIDGASLKDDVETLKRKALAGDSKKLENDLEILKIENEKKSLEILKMKEEMNELHHFLALVNTFLAVIFCGAAYQRDEDFNIYILAMFLSLSYLGLSCEFSFITLIGFKKPS
ncbi:hypothetical protein DFJ63DRAFT_336618 [Scheffersomyces coipomensis]|uniref:uncharacterized protein n=1 Tax=Scheffersomyces coipomensis TaxID=1788519 RepID=UPI00315C9510